MRKKLLFLSLALMAIISGASFYLGFNSSSKLEDSTSKVSSNKTSKTRRVSGANTINYVALYRFGNTAEYLAYDLTKGSNEMVQHLLSHSGVELPSGVKAQYFNIKADMSPRDVRRLFNINLVEDEVLYLRCGGIAFQKEDSSVDILKVIDEYAKHFGGRGSDSVLSFNTKANFDRTPDQSNTSANLYTYGLLWERSRERRSPTPSPAEGVNERNAKVLSYWGQQQDIRLALRKHLVADLLEKTKASFITQCLYWNVENDNSFDILVVKSDTMTREDLDKVQKTIYYSDMIDRESNVGGEMPKVDFYQEILPSMQ